MSRRVQVVFPDDLFERLQDAIPEGKRSEFIVEGTRRLLLRELQRQALTATAGAWSDPSQEVLDTPGGVEAYLRELREPDEARSAALEKPRDGG